MFIIDDTGTDPFFNLAVEEIFLKNRSEEFIILGKNRQSVIAGKHQCIHREADTEFVNENHIPVMRRITGGGTVYHDEGNLNFAFIRNCEPGRQIDFYRHLAPVLDFLDSAGVNASIRGSDIISGGKKISGNAEHVHRNRVLHHGTLLFDADLDIMRKTLRSDTSGYSTRAVASNPSPVTNLSKIITHFRKISEFQAAMSDFFRQKFNAEQYVLREDEKEEASILAGTKYNSWDWTYAYGPDYVLKKSIIFMGYGCSVTIVVKDGVINECLISGNGEAERIAPELKGMKHMPGDIERAIRGILPGYSNVYNFF